MPNANVSSWNAGAVLARWNIKPIDIVNMMIAATALGFSLYAASQARAHERQTELFGGYILGYQATDLELCEAGNEYRYAHCDHPITSVDFRSLKPVLDSLLQIPLDWPPEQPRKPDSIGFGGFPEAAPTVITDALQAHYSDRVVQSAFTLGSAMRSLLALSDDTGIGRDPHKRAAYIQLANNVKAILSSTDFKGVCSQHRFNSDSPTHNEITDLNSCLQQAWVPLLNTPTPAP